MAVAGLALLFAATAIAGGVSGAPPVGRASFVSADLRVQASQDPGKKLHVIVQSAGGVVGAENALRGLGASVRRELNVVGAVAIDVTAGKLNELAKQPGLTITLDAPVKLSGSLYSSSQMWPFESGDAKLWPTTSSAGPTPATIAIVDSGIDASRLDFTGRVYPQINLSSLTPTASGDDRGHGTFVAGIAAGAAPGYAGAAPTARILPIRVMDQNGVAMTSDVIAACQWILANKLTYNIRVANFSLHSGTRNHFYNDPLDKAVEQLWFHGVVVVAAAGNYGVAAGPSGVWYAPGNDPFVITVGAVDLGGSIGVGNDAAAPWSAYGYTEDGFAKPELSAAGRYMVGPVDATTTLAAQRPDHIVAPGYMELSGTSFAAPVVAGSAAQILAYHPDWTPDQVKGALMLTAKQAPNAAPGSIGVGEVNTAKAALGVLKPPNANTAIDNFLTADGSGGLVFDAATWNSTVAASASWADASWADASWADASWSTASWADASWAEASWTDASWTDASWANASWADTSVEDGATDPTQPIPLLDPAALTDLQADPDLALPVDTTQTTTDTMAAPATATPLP